MVRSPPLRPRWALLLGLATSAGPALEAQSAERIDSRPNLLLVLVDDVGWRDVGYQGADFFETPNIDRLASEGLAFSAGYAAAANCAPSRACLMSGLYTPRHGVYAVGSTGKGPEREMRLQPVDNEKSLAPETVTLAEALRDAGYATGIFGKWGLNGGEGTLSLDQGFDVAYDSFGRGELEQGARHSGPGPPEDPKGVYTLTDRACAFMATERAEPFFCFLSHRALHQPLQARPESLEHFDAKAGDRQPIEGVPRRHALMYAANLFDLDDSVGRLLRFLETEDLARRTVVVFTSDNGAMQRSPQEPLRGNKGCYYEGGIRVPFIVRWPGVVTAGGGSATPVSQVDLYPTFLDLAGAAPSEGAALDGRSLVPLLHGQRLPERALFWHFPGYLNHPVRRGRDTVFRTRPVSVIRRGQTKLLLFYEEWLLDGGRESLATNRALELYDLASDPGERHDLSLVEPELRDSLLDELLAWVESVDAALPVPARAGRQARRARRR